MISEKKVLHILDNLYENAKNGTSVSWFGTYQQIAQLASSGLGGLTVFVGGDGRTEVVATDFDQASLEVFYEHYQYINPMRESLVRLMPGEWVSRLKICPDPEFRASEIYQDYFRKLDIFEIEYHALGPTPETSGGLTLTRPRSNPVFSKDERKALDFLVPHLERAFQLYLLLNEAQRENRQMTETLSKIPQSIIVLDSCSKVIFRNESAEKLIGQEDGLSVERGILSAGTVQDTRKLRGAVANAFALGNKHLVDPVGVVQLSRPSGRRPLQVLVAPFCAGAAVSFLPETLALVFVFDPEVRPSTADDILRRIYGLTPAEARITSLIAQGFSTKEAGEVLSISENTVRTHLKRIFSKTETSRQSDLVNLVLNGPANLNNHSL